MQADTTNTETAPTAPNPHTAKIRSVFRTGHGECHLDWPRERIAEATQDPEGTLWVDIEDPDGACVAEIEALFKDVFGFHPLAIEDALRESNVPKIDDWDRYLYVVFHAIDFDPKTDEITLHELDCFLARNYLVTYRTRAMPLVERVRKTVANDSQNRMRRRADHILYLLLDQGVADHLTAIEHLDESVDEIMDIVLEKPIPATLQRIFQIKRSTARLYRVIVPQREVANRLTRDPYAQIGDRDRVYFRDVYDGLVRLHDLTEGIRDLVSGAIDTYLSVSANRTNEIMKTLTIVTVLFLPLNFVVGFFGMNFFGGNIELDRLWSWHTAWFALGCCVMLGAAIGIWMWGRHRGWY